LRNAIRPAPARRSFPSTDTESNVHTRVDRFFASKPGKPAFEVKVNDSIARFQAIFTASFLSAFENPTDTMVSTIGGVTYVPTRQLEDFLDNDVTRRAREKSINLNQRPQAIIESDQTAYIGRAIRIASGQPTPPVDRHHFRIWQIRKLDRLAPTCSLLIA
jgi:hypothetical protein